MLSDPSFYLRNKTAPTSPVDPPSLLGSKASAAFVEEQLVMAVPCNSQPEPVDELPNCGKTSDDTKDNNDEPIKFILNDSNEVNDNDSNKQVRCFGKGHQRKRRKSLCQIG